MRWLGRNCGSPSYSARKFWWDACVNNPHPRKPYRVGHSFGAAPLTFNHIFFHHLADRNWRDVALTEVFVELR